MDRTDPASTTDCPFGGSVVSSGFDDNRNGTLDDAEIEKRTAVCNDAPGEPPPPLVFRLVPEFAGSTCERDGTAVQSGPDRNRNGRLDDDEVEHVEYACGEEMLTRLVAEPAGARCVAGGVAVLIGRDRDHDRQLADGEIEVTEVECGSELSRDVTLRTAEDAAALGNITLIAGSLAVAESGIADLSLPRLVQVRGALEVTGNVQLARLAMPALQSVDGRFTLARNAQLIALELPALQRVDSLVIDRDVALADLSGFSAPAEVVHELQISGNDALVSAELPLERVGGDVTFDGNARLTHVVWSLEGTSTVRITSNPALETVMVGSTGFQAFGPLTVSANARLDRITVTASGIGALRIEDNAALSDVVVTTFDIDGDVVVSGNGPLQLALLGGSTFGLAILGAVSVAGPVQALDLPTPVAVTGDFTIDGTQVSTLGTQSRFTQIGGSLTVTNNPELILISPFLVGGNLELRGNPRLSSLGFLGQDQIDGDLTVADNPGLAAAPSLEALRRVRGDVRIAGNPALKVAFGPTLDQVDGSLAFDGNDQLNDLGLSRMTHAGSLSVTHCGALTELALPALTDVASIQVRGNAELRHLQLPVLRSADLGVFDNPHLPACEVEALFAVLLGEHHQSGNDETAVCP